MENKPENRKMSETSKCGFCGKENKTTWKYCSNTCIIKAKKRASNENAVLHLRVENAQLRKHAFAVELEAEGFDSSWKFKSTLMSDLDHTV